MTTFSLFLEQREMEEYYLRKMEAIESLKRAFYPITYMQIGINFNQMLLPLLHLCEMRMSRLVGLMLRVEVDWITSVYTRMPRSPI